MSWYSLCFLPCMRPAACRPSLGGPSQVPSRRPLPPSPSQTPTPGPGVYVHPGKRFVIRFQATWQVIRAINDRSHAVYYFTPEAGQTDYRQLKATLAVSLVPVPDASTLVGLDAVGVLRHFLPLIRTAQPGLAPVGEVTKARSVRSMPGQSRSREPSRIARGLHAGGLHGHERWRDLPRSRPGAQGGVRRTLADFSQDRPGTRSSAAHGPAAAIGRSRPARSSTGTRPRSSPSTPSPPTRAGPAAGSSSARTAIC